MTIKKLYQDLEQYLNENLVEIDLDNYDFKKKSVGKINVVCGGTINILGDSLNDYIHKNQGKEFYETLGILLKERNLEKESEIYTKAGLDRRTFSKMRANHSVTKKNVLAMALALGLNRKEVDELLASAGLAISNHSRFDLIICFCIEKKIYNLFDVNELLIEHNLEIIGGCIN